MGFTSGGKKDIYLVQQKEAISRPPEIWNSK